MYSHTSKRSHTARHREKRGGTTSADPPVRLSTRAESGRRSRIEPLRDSGVRCVLEPSVSILWTSARIRVRSGCRPSPKDGGVVRVVFAHGMSCSAYVASVVCIASLLNPPHTYGVSALPTQYICPSLAVGVWGAVHLKYYGQY